MVVALGPLVEIAGLLVALGIITLAVILTEALFAVADTTVAWIPWVGKKASNGVRTIEHRLVSRMSSFAVGIQGAISDSWHILANLIEETGAAIWEATELGARALYAWEVQLPIKLAKLLAHAGENVGHKARAALAPVTNNYYTYKGITRAQFARYGARLGKLEARLAALPALGAGALVLPFPRLGVLERAWHGVTGRLGKLEHRFGRTAFAAAVATALATLGVSWARKSCAKRTADGFCKVDPDVFAGLIAGLAVVVGAQSVVRFANGMLAVEDEFVSVLERMIVELGDIGE